MRFEFLILYAAAEKASEVFVALASAFGNKGFFKNKGPDPTVGVKNSEFLEFY